MRCLIPWRESGDVSNLWNEVVVCVEVSKLMEKNKISKDGKISGH